MRRAFAAGIVAAAFVAANLGAAIPVAASPSDVVVVVPGPSAPPEQPEPTRSRVTHAQLRWGLNTEAGSGAFFGGCNFLSAGTAGDSGGARVWGAGDGLYRSNEGAVRIEKPNAAGEWGRASFETRCLDAQGRAVTTSSTSSTTGSQVVIDGGTGSVRADGGLDVRWTGSFTVAFYGGMTYWSVSDPVLTLDAGGSGRLVGTASGYGTSMEDMSRWEPIAAQSIVLAEIRGADLSGGAGFVVVPEYLGVSVTGGDQIERRTENADHWGSFPQSFVDFQSLTGQRAYWLTSGGVRDRAKPATELYVSYDAAAPIAVPPPAGASGGGADVSGGAIPSNPLRMPAAVPPISDVPEVPMAPVVAVSPLTTLPSARDLVPEAVTALSPLVVPLLGTAAALGIAIIAVMSLMRMLPWQRRSA